MVRDYPLPQGTVTLDLSTLDATLALNRSFTTLLRRDRPKGMPWRWHETTSLRTPEGVVVQVDVRIAPLISALWRRGIHTLYSCEGGGDLRRGYIMFRDGKSVGGFKQVLRGFNDADILRWDGYPHRVVRFPHTILAGLTAHVMRRVAS